MGSQKATTIDELVMTRLRKTQSVPVSEDIERTEVGIPTLDTPTTGEENPLEWLTNPVGLDVTPRYKVGWAESGQIVSPITKLRFSTLD